MSRQTEGKGSRFACEEAMGRCTSWARRHQPETPSNGSGKKIESSARSVCQKESERGEGRGGKG